MKEKIQRFYKLRALATALLFDLYIIHKNFKDLAEHPGIYPAYTVFPQKSFSSTHI
jgi:hypothetical protein